MENIFNKGMTSTMNNLLTQQNNTIMPNTTIESDKDKGKKKNNNTQQTNQTQTKKPNQEYDFNSEMMGLYNKPLKYDNNQNSLQLVDNVSKQMGISPSLLYSSAYIEGMNQAITAPDNVSEAYNEAHDKNKELTDEDLTKYPVDGFLNYGLDTFVDKYEKLKKYLPKDFDKKFKPYTAEQELTDADRKAGRKKGMSVKTAAFMNNQDALIAKSAMLKMEEENVTNYAKKNGLQLDDDAKDYFIMASYNSGPSSMQKMMDEYSKSKDKKSFIEKGETKYKGVHVNVNRRMKMRKQVNDLLAKNSNPKK
jgi:hypothetical protein